MRGRGNPPDIAPPDYLDYDMWTGPAPMRPYCELRHPRRWRAFMEYSNGIVGDMCVHMLDMVRWMLDLGWPKSVHSEGGIYVQTGGKSNITDTQSAVFEYEDFDCHWQHRSWGTPADPDYPWAFKIYGEKGTLAGSVMQYDFTPQGDGSSLHGDALYELEKFPNDKNEADIELHAVPATRRHLIDFLASIENDTRPFSDIEEGHISTASCILANLSMKAGRPLRYDAKNHTLTGDPEAAALLRRAYREGWEHPYPAG
jgi:predicted dehydrogenase